MKRMVTVLVAGLVLGGVTLAGAQEAPAVIVHDCRIRALGIRATKRGDTLILRAIYYGMDMQALRPGLCPDQNGPTWGTDRDVRFIDQAGYVAAIDGPTGEVVSVSIATVQNPERSFYVERRIRF